MITNFAELVALTKATAKKTRIALCCAQDAHALEAMVQARREGLIEGVLIGETDVLREMLQKMGEEPTAYEILSCKDEADSVRVAAELVREGSAGVIMKGKMQTSSLLSGVLKKENGLRTGRPLSVCGNFQLCGQIKGARNRLLTVTDPALNISPDCAMKAALLGNALALRHALGDTLPKAAIIAANEIPNPKSMASMDAVTIKEMAQNGEYGACLVDGPISLDLAINPEAVRLKDYQSPVAGDADTLLMPDLVSANVLAKALTDISGISTAGIVVGARVPVVLVSRASVADDKFHSIALAAYTSQALQEAL